MTLGRHMWAQLAALPLAACPFLVHGQWDWVDSGEEDPVSCTSGDTDDPNLKNPELGQSELHTRTRRFGVLITLRTCF